MRTMQSYHKAKDSFMNDFQDQLFFSPYNSFLRATQKTVALTLIVSFLFPSISQAMYNGGDENSTKTVIARPRSLEDVTKFEVKKEAVAPTQLSRTSEEDSPLGTPPSEEVDQGQTSPDRKKNSDSSSPQTSPEKSPRSSDDSLPKSSLEPDSPPLGEKKSSKALKEGEDLSCDITVVKKPEKKSKDFGVQSDASASHHTDNISDVEEIEELGARAPAEDRLTFGSWVNIPTGQQFALVSMHDSSINGGFTDRTPLLYNDEHGGFSPQKRPVVEQFLNGGSDEDPRYPNSSSVRIAVLDPKNDIDARVLAFLRYADKHIKRGRITCLQGIVGGVGGTLIGAGVGNAMPAIFSDGLASISENFHHELGWNPPVQDAFITHTAVSLGIDSVSRNAMILGDLVGPSTEEFSILGNKPKIGPIPIDLRKGLQCVVFAGAGLAALLPVYYLWSVEEKDIRYAPDHKKEMLTFFWCLAPTLWLDALFMNARGLQSWTDEKINDRLIKRAFAGSHFASARQARKETLEEFEDLERLFRWTSDNDISEIYEEVLRKGLNINRNRIHLPEMLEPAEGLRTLKTLKEIYRTYDLPEDYAEEGSWKTWVSNVAGLSIPLLATAGRSLVFYIIIYHMLGDLGLDNEIGRAALAAPLGGGIASLFQGKVEADAVKRGVYELLNGEDTEGDASHSYIRSGARKLGKGYTYLQGAWNTLPYVLAGIASTHGWPLAIQICTLLFFGVADAFNNAMSFNESYGGVVQGAESIASYGLATTAYKRNKLLRMVRGYKRTYEMMPPHILERSHQLVSYTGQENSIDDQVLNVFPIIELDEEIGQNN